MTSAVLPLSLALTASATVGLLASSATAAPEAGAPLVLSLAQARDRAARLAPEVRLAVDRVRSAEATHVGASVRMPVNPRISVDGRPGLAASDRGKVGFASTLDLLFEVSDAPGARLAEADARTRLAGTEVDLARVEARTAALAAYVGTALQDRRLEYARRVIAVSERVLAAARERSAAGAAGDIDVASARAELAEVRAELQSAVAQRALQEHELRLLVGADASQPLRLGSAIDVPPPAPPLAALRQKAAALRPELAVLEARLGLLAASDARLRSEARPKVGAFLGVDASPASPVFGIAGLSFELPLAQRNQEPRAVIAAERQTELDRLALVARRIDLAIAASRAAFEARREAVTLLTQEGIPAAEARLTLVETGWRAGRFDVFRLTSATQGLVRLQARRLQMLEEIWRERVLLERLIGGWIDEGS